MLNNGLIFRMIVKISDLKPNLKVFFYGINPVFTTQVALLKPTGNYVATFFKNSSRFFRLKQCQISTDMLFKPFASLVCAVLKQRDDFAELNPLIAARR